MESNPEIYDETVRTAFKLRLIGNAMDHLTEFDARTGLAFLRQRLIKDPNFEKEDTVAMRVLGEEAHAARVKTVPGPLLAYFENSDKTSIGIMEVTPLLMNYDSAVRMKAVNYFIKILEQIPHPKRERLAAVFVEQRENISSTDIQTWSKSATKLFDLISDDFFCNLAALSQSIKLKFTEGIDDYIPKVLRPPVSSLEWIELPIAVPSAEHSELELVIKDCVIKADSFIDACNLYYAKLGCFPLVGQFALSAVLKEWRQQKSNVENLWSILWNWAHEKRSPFAFYHVCELFCQNTGLIEKDKCRQFWDEIFHVILRIKPTDFKSKFEGDWEIRNDLAQLYLKLFEIQRPERNSEAITRFAWWLAEEVAKALSGELLPQIHANLIKTYLANATLAWQTVSPNIQASPLRTATLNTRSIWSSAIICQIGQALMELDYETLSASEKDVLETAIGAQISICFPLSLSPAKAPTYQFEESAYPVAKTLVEKLSNKTQIIDLAALCVAREKIQSNEDVKSKLNTVLQLEKPEQSLTALAFRMQVYLNVLQPDEVWKIVVDDAWIKNVLIQLDMTLLQFILDALNVMQVNGGETWRCNLPHVLAYAAELAYEDKERQKILFLYVVLTSISGNTTSAIDRLKSGRRRLDFIEHANFLREQFRTIIQHEDPWICARIRPALVSLAGG